MAKFHVRCKDCEMRRVFRFLPEQYEVIPKCEGCQVQRYRVDKWMQTRNTRKMGCLCAGYHFFHRQGSLYCWHRANGSIRAVGDYDFADRNIDSLDLTEYQNEHNRFIAQQRAA